MPFCSNCGTEVNDNQAVCLQCGVSTKKAFDIEDKGGFVWGLLGFFVPIAGLVLYLIWMDTKPKTAKAAGMGALVYLGFFAVVMILYVVFFAIIMSTGFYY